MCEEELIEVPSHNYEEREEDIDASYIEEDDLLLLVKLYPCAVFWLRYQYNVENKVSNIY